MRLSEIDSESGMHVDPKARPASFSWSTDASIPTLHPELLSGRVGSQQPQQHSI